MILKLAVTLKATGKPDDEIAAQEWFLGLAMVEAGSAAEIVAHLPRSCEKIRGTCQELADTCKGCKDYSLGMAHHQLRDLMMKDSDTVHTQEETWERASEICRRLNVDIEGLKEEGRSQKAEEEKAAKAAEELMEVEMVPCIPTAEEDEIFPDEQEEDTL